MAAPAPAPDLLGRCGSVRVAPVEVELEKLAFDRRRGHILEYVVVNPGHADNRTLGRHDERSAEVFGHVVLDCRSEGIPDVVAVPLVVVLLRSALTDLESELSHQLVVTI